MTAITDSGWLSTARRCPSPNFGPRPAGAEVDLLVIHNISLPPGQFGGGFIQQFFQNRLDSSEHPFFAEIAKLQVSSHLLIERDGTLTQFVSFDDRAWHAGVSCFEGRENCNDYSIGVELEGTDSTPYTERQYQVLGEVTDALMRRYGIKPARIVGHCDIAPERKSDPGPSFNWSRYRAQLEYIQEDSQA